MGAVRCLRTCCSDTLRTGLFCRWHWLGVIGVQVLDCGDGGMELLPGHGRCCAELVHEVCPFFPVGLLSPLYLCVGVEPAGPCQEKWNVKPRVCCWRVLVLRKWPLSCPCFFFFCPPSFLAARKFSAAGLFHWAASRHRLCLYWPVSRCAIGREGVSPDLPLPGWESTGRHSWAGVGEELAGGWKISVQVVVGGKIFKQKTGGPLATGGISVVGGSARVGSWSSVGWQSRKWGGYPLLQIQLRSWDR